MASRDRDRDLADVVCWSHIRWRAQRRPRHLMLRFARARRVFFVEEPLGDDAPNAVARLEQTLDDSGVRVVVPRMPRAQREDDEAAVLSALFRDLYGEHDIRAPLSWYDSPLFLAMTRTLPASVVVYDCMHGISAVEQPLLSWLESELLSRTHIVFAASQTLFERKQERHPNVHLVPCCVDVTRGVAQAASAGDGIAARPQRPRIGCAARGDAIDHELVRAIAAHRPDWQVLDLADASENEDAAPSFADWDAALLPLTTTDNALFLDPRHTVERATDLLGAGFPVVATPHPDIVSRFDRTDVLHIVSTPDAAVAALERALAQRSDPRAMRSLALFLATMSWESAFERITAALDELGPKTRTPDH